MVIGGFKDTSLTKCILDVELFSLTDPHFKLSLQPLPKCMKNLVGGLVTLPNYEDNKIPLVCDTEITPKPCLIFIEGSWNEANITLKSGFKSNSFAQYNDTSILAISNNDSYLINIENNSIHGGFIFVSPGHSCIANLERIPWIFGVQGDRTLFSKSITTEQTNQCPEHHCNITHPTWCEVAYINTTSKR